MTKGTLEVTDRLHAIMAQAGRDALWAGTAGPIARPRGVSPMAEDHSDDSTIVGLLTACCITYG